MFSWSQVQLVGPPAPLLLMCIISYHKEIFNDLLYILTTTDIVSSLIFICCFLYVHPLSLSTSSHLILSSSFTIFHEYPLYFFLRAFYIIITIYHQNLFFMQYLVLSSRIGFFYVVYVSAHHQIITKIPFYPNSNWKPDIISSGSLPTAFYLFIQIRYFFTSILRFFRS